jgi:hypothetical protein
MVAGRIRAVLLAGMALILVACGDDAETETKAASPVNHPPAIEGKPARTINAGQAYSFSPTASDPDGDPIRFGIDGLPKWLTFNPATGRLTGTPQASDVGVHRGIVVWVSDGKIESLLPPLEIEVLPASAPANRPPLISGTPGNTVIADTFYEFLPIASDADGDRLTFTVENLPRWASFDPAIGRVSGTPAIGDLGPYAGIVIRVSDGVATNVLGPFAVIVNPPPAQNRAPVISGSPDPNVLVGQVWSFQPPAADPDGDPLGFQVFGAPDWMSLNSATGLLSGTPNAAHIGTHGGIQLIVTDGQASASLPAFSVEVISANSPPLIGGSPPTSISRGQFYSFTPVVHDPDGDPLTFTVSGLPAWASFNGSTGGLAGTPTGTGTFANIVITVSDGQAAASLPAFSIAVVNSTPVISGAPLTAIGVGQPYNFTPAASDADGDALTFTVTGLPAWASFNGTTGSLGGIPPSAGIFANIVITVSDGQLSASLPAFSIVAVSSNLPPAISGSPPTSIFRGQFYGFTPTVSDPNGDTLGFAVTGLPAWASFDGGTGTVTGTPAIAGTYSGIVIAVSDGQASASLPAFSIVVMNSPPLIGGVPANTVLVDSAYGFAPTASDPEGDPLTFSVAGLPVWASFNAANGAITGTPGAGDVGVYGGVMVTVSDGNAGATLGPFSIQVLPRATGSALLSWLPPTQNVDGSLINNLAGFVVYWGTTPGSYPNSMRLQNPGSTTYLVENLLPGTTYYFVTTAFNSLGLESDFSNVASKTIP